MDSHMKLGDRRYIISDAAKMVDVESHVLRYWEEELEVEVPRNELGHRYYTDYYIELFRRIKELKDNGFQLKAIKMVLPDLMEGTAMENNAMANSAMASNAVANTAMTAREMGDKDFAGGTDRMREQLFAKLLAEQIAEQEKEQAAEQTAEQAKELAAEQEKGQEKKQAAEQEKEQTVKQDKQIQTIKESEERQGSPADQTASSEAGLFTTDNSALTPAKAEPVDEKPAENSKLQQFQMIITEVVSNALKENTTALGQEVSEIVSDNVLKEMDYLMNLREKQEEERFKKLDETIRSYQNSNREKTKNTKGLLAKLKRN